MPTWDLTETMESTIHLRAEPEGDRLHLLAYADDGPGKDCRDLVSCLLDDRAVRVLLQACADHLGLRNEVLVGGGAV